MIIFSVSHKGGTGRSVTSTNLAYRAALRGYNTCYLDFDFGSPTIGTIFDVENTIDGVIGNGLHDFLGGRSADVQRVSVWAESKVSGSGQPPGAGSLTLLPGSRGGGEFSVDKATVDRCTELFVKLDEEFDLILVDLSAGRSFAVELALQCTARPALRMVPARWLVFHRWTRQHVRAAHDLVYGERGLLNSAVSTGHDDAVMRTLIRFVRTAYIDPHSPSTDHLSPTQQNWLFEMDRDLEALSARLKLGRSVRLGSVSLDAVLQWREQLITDRDVKTLGIAHEETVRAYEDLAQAVTDPAVWESI
ncbi:P-loop NTPase [Actinocrinis puniceicyclus]|uniref:P-loop NTPase n=1 Tax=Actinocrinis puniceicyclus TaxID=977794 RepID=A0A8J7WLK2_9ACTN|nr:SCO2523 family variant P-loop protein [Actinocrinis puniceicyclus]MBS2964586.1 P-loop NTPase [Actinocrinis puniceicyclus]